MKANIVSILIAVTLGSLAGLGHINSVEAHKADQKITVVKVVNMDTETEDRCVPVYLDADIPEEVQIAAERYGLDYNISPELLEAIAYYESRYVSDVDNKSGSNKGLMQIAPKWHKARMEKLGVTDLHDADQNMHVAADYLAELFEEHEDVAIVLMRYNGDSSWKRGNVSKYAKKVIAKAEELAIKHQKESQN